MTKVHFDRNVLSILFEGMSILVLVGGGIFSIYYNFKILIVNFGFLFIGLVAVGERAQKRSGNFSAAMKDLSGENEIPTHTMKS